MVRIFDWDQFGSDELLAEGFIPIDQLESFSAQNVEVPLTGGKIALRLKWEPQLLSRKREGTSLISSTTRILSSGTGFAGDVVGMGVGAGGKVLTGGGKIVGGVVGGGTKIVGGAINGGFGALGRGFGKLGGSGHSKKASEASVTSPIPASTIATSPVATSPQTLADKVGTEPPQPIVHQSMIGSITSSESTSGRRSLFEESKN